MRPRRQRDRYERDILSFASIRLTSCIPRGLFSPPPYLSPPLSLSPSPPLSLRCASLGIGTILAIVSLFTYRAIPYAKQVSNLTDVFMVLGVLLVPCGYTYLDDSCPSGLHQGQCGLICEGNGKMELFVLCPPYSMGASAYLSITGVVLIFIATFVSSCVRSKRGMSSSFFGGRGVGGEGEGKREVAFVALTHAPCLSRLAPPLLLLSSFTHR